MIINIATYIILAVPIFVLCLVTYFILNNSKKKQGLSAEERKQMVEELNDAINNGEIDLHEYQQTQAVGEQRIQRMLEQYNPLSQ